MSTTLSSPAGSILGTAPATTAPQPTNWFEQYQALEAAQPIFIGSLCYMPPTPADDGAGGHNRWALNVRTKDMRFFELTLNDADLPAFAAFAAAWTPPS